MTPKRTTTPSVLGSDITPNRSPNRSNWDYCDEIESNIEADKEQSKKNVDTYEDEQLYDNAKAEPKED